MGAKQSSEKTQQFMLAVARNDKKYVSGKLNAGFKINSRDIYSALYGNKRMPDALNLVQIQVEHIVICKSFRTLHRSLESKFQIRLLYTDDESVRARRLNKMGHINNLRDECRLE